MKKTNVIALFLFLAVSVSNAGKGYCQSTISADTLKKMLIQDWERGKAYTGDYMKAMPADKYSFKATDSVRTFAQQLLHLAEANMFFVATATGEKSPYSGSHLDKSTSAQSADSVMYYVNSSYDFAINSLQKMPASSLIQPKSLNMGQSMTATSLSWLMKGFEHQTHHRGQTTIYLRLAGIRPPDERLF